MGMLVCENFMKRVGSINDRSVSTVVVHRMHVVFYLLLKLIAFWTVFYPLL